MALAITSAFAQDANSEAPPGKRMDTVVVTATNDGLRLDESASKSINGSLSMRINW